MLACPQSRGPAGHLSGAASLLIFMVNAYWIT
jgi:hypothetical protein